MFQSYDRQFLIFSHKKYYNKYLSYSFDLYLFQGRGEALYVSQAILGLH